VDVSVKPAARSPSARAKKPRGSLGRRVSFAPEGTLCDTREFHDVRARAAAGRRSFAQA
jgi:hypothetical protein